MISKLLVVTLVLASTPVWAVRAKPDPRLSAVTSIFVTGNNQAAEKIREQLSKGKSCLTLALKADEADAVLDVSTDTKSQGDSGFGAFGAREWIVSGTLTLKSGELVWSKSERFGDAPFRSGGKVAGDLLLHRLTDAVGCKARAKK
jgi:hypothetical protein